MYKLFVIAKNNMKKQKGDMITFLILTFLSAFLIFDCAAAITGIGHVLDDKFDEINGAHVFLYCGDSDEETAAAEKAFKDNDDIKEYEQTPAIRLNAKYRKKGEKDFMDYTFFAESFDEVKTIMNVKRPERSYKDDDILLPFNMHGTYAVGDVIQIKLDDDVYDLNVVGYLEDPYFCSTMNLTYYSVNISQEMMNKMHDEHSNLALSMLIHKGRTDEAKLETGTISTNDIEEVIGNVFKDELAKTQKDNPEKAFPNYVLANWQMMRGGSQFLPITVIAVILMFATLIMIIAIVIISFSVKNFIQKNMKNTGILEASGYTVKELRCSLILQIILVGLVGSLIGIGVGICTFENFGQIVSMVLGLSWNQPVNWMIAGITVISVVGILGIVAVIISATYKRISVLDALRGGINTHNFKKNYFSFETTPLPIPVTMALKETFGGLGKNVIMVVIAAILAISTLAGFGLLENFGKDPNTMIKMFGFEMGTAVVTDDDMSTDYEKVSEALNDIDGVNSVLTVSGTDLTVKFNDEEKSIFTFFYDDISNSTNTVFLEGRGPEKDNEIMMTPGVMDDLGAKIGDVVTIEYADKEADYIIVGMNQRMERMGRTILMTIEGSKRIIPVGLQYQYYISAKDGADYDDVLNGLDELEKNENLHFSSQDYHKMMESTVDSLGLAMKLICITIVVVTILVVIFVESLVIRAKISREWRGMGISKALGQTSGNLISQIMLSNMPAILTGTVIGALLSPMAGEGMCKAAFSIFVMKSVPFNIPTYYMLVTVVGIMAIAILTSGSAGLKVRGLKPVEMITEE